MMNKEAKNWTVRCYYVSGFSKRVKSFGEDRLAAQAYAEVLDAKAKAEGSDFCFDIVPFEDMGD